MNTSHTYLAHFLGTGDLTKLPPLAATKKSPKQQPGVRKKKAPVVLEEELKELDAELAEEHARQNNNNKTNRFPPIKKRKERRSVAMQAKEKFTDVNTRTIRTLVTKPNATVDKDELEAEELAMITGFTVIKVRDLRKIYRAAVKQTPGLAMHSFKRVMKTFGLSDTELLGRIFEILDVSRSKRLSFRQFIDCIYLFMKGTRDQQAKVLFKMIDVSDDRSISKLEMLRFFAGGTVMRDEKKLISSIVNEMMTLIDEDGSGEVTFDEFVNKVAHDEEVWECFQSISPLTQLIEAMHLNGVSSPCP